MSDTSPNRTQNIITIVVGVLLLATIGVLIYQNVNQGDDIEEFEYQMEDLNVEIIDLEDDLKELKTDLDSKDLDIEEKDRMLAERELAIVEKQIRIDMLEKANRISKEEAAELRAKVEQLQYYTAKYQKQITQLKVEIGDLTSMNDQLRGNLQNLQDENSQIEEENLKTKTLLEAARILKAADFKFYRIKGSGKEVAETEFKGGRLKDLKICFSVLENSAAFKGKRGLYMTIFKPSGVPLNDLGQGGHFEFDGKKMPFTLKAHVDYKKKTVSVCSTYTKAEDMEMEKGTYAVKVFCEGYDIGTGSFIIK